MKKNPFNVKMTEREKDLTSLGKPVVCVSCRETSYLYPKGVGYHPYQWEMNCNLCHHYAIGLDAYIPEHTVVVKTLEQLRKRYIDGQSNRELEREIHALAQEFDSILDNRVCGCGGSLSITAKPKCIYCDIEIFDSYFHVADEAPHGR
jgi:hypothetical protein